MPARESNSKFPELHNSQRMRIAKKRSLSIDVSCLRFYKSKGVECRNKLDCKVAKKQGAIVKKLNSNRSQIS